MLINTNIALFYGCFNKIDSAKNWNEFYDQQRYFHTHAVSMEKQTEQSEKCTSTKEAEKGKIKFPGSLILLSEKGDATWSDRGVRSTVCCFPCLLMLTVPEGP